MAERIGDEAVKKATGKDWQSWFSFLTNRSENNDTHKGLVAILKKEGVSPWWCQSIAGEYEKKFLGRKTHEMPAGFQATASKTINSPIKTVFESFDNGNAAWLPDGSIDVSTVTANKALRGEWTGTHKGRIDAYFTKKDPHKTQITINHTKLADEIICNERKTAWRNALNALKAKLEKE